jgi:hypothetical protein
MEVPIEFTGGAVVLGFGVPPKPDFWLHQGSPQKPRLHVAFRAETRVLVDAFHRAALPYACFALTTASRCRASIALTMALAEFAWRTSGPSFECAAERRHIREAHAIRDL